MSDLKIILFGLVACCGLFVKPAFALKIPQSLSSNDRSKIVSQLGAALSLKTLGGSYSLGGYTGFEFGVVSQIAPTAFLSQLGSGAPQEQNLVFNSVSIGKGLFNNFDFHFVFSPWSGASDVNSYGSQVSWSFAEAKTLPAHFAAQVSANSIRFLDSLYVTNVSYDLIFGIYFQNFNVFSGFGLVRGWGAFEKKLNSSNQLEEVISETVQSSVGVNYKLQNYFASLQVNRVTESSIQAQIGYSY